MSKSDSDFLMSGKSFRKVRLIDGTCTPVKTKDLVGYCNCDTHKGHVTVKLMEQHDCLNKRCVFLDKFLDYPYWVNKSNIDKAKARHKKQVKLKKVQKDLLYEQIQKKCGMLLSSAQEIADSLSYPILIVRVAPQRSADNNYTFIINYVSNFPFNDWSEYFSLVKELSKLHGGRYILRRLKLPNGKYAIFEDINH